MTTTEDRLTDALNAAARSVTAPSLRPLDDHPAPAQDPANRQVNRRRWLAAVASAAAVALIAGLAVSISARLRTPPVGGDGTPPRYYVGLDPKDQLVVRATATGKVTSIVPPPRHGHLHFFSPLAAAGDRTFFVQVTTESYTARIYRFRVTAAGRVTGLAPLPGGALPSRRIAQQMAASPDGSRLAVSLHPGAYKRNAHHAEIMVINTRTGARTVWTDGQAPPGQSAPSLTLLQLSWTGDGRELAYLEVWMCKAGPLNTACVQPMVNAYEEVRALDPARGGGSLDSGRLLLRRPRGGLEAAAITPDGSALTTVVVPRRHSAHPGATVTRPGPPEVMKVAQVPAGTSGRARILYRLITRTTDLVWSFEPGKAGQFLILIAGVTRFTGGTVNGWIADGRLHRLPFPYNSAYSEAW